MIRYKCKKCSKTFTHERDYDKHCNKSDCAFDGINVHDIVDIIVKLREEGNLILTNKGLERKH